jgi:WD40 repeat protein
MHVLAGHKGAVTSVAVHPSGKLALSVGRDNTLRLWNLVQGRCSFTRRLKGSAEKVLWHKSGMHYLIIVGSEVQVFRASDNECIVSVKHKSRVNQAVFCEVAKCDPADGDGESPATSESDRIGCICDDRMLFLYDFSGTQKAELNLSELGGRPRDMWNSALNLDSLKDSTHDQERVKPMVDALSDEGDCLAIATSLGHIALLSCRAIEEGHTLEESTLISTDIRSEPRLTAVVAWSPPSVTTSNTKQVPSKTQKVQNKSEVQSTTVRSTDRGGHEAQAADGTKKKRKVTLEEPQQSKGDKKQSVVKSKKSKKSTA